MAFQISPGVQVKEKDLTSIIPAVSSTVAGFAGKFQWGPSEQRVTVDSENNLRSLFGDPDDNNYEHFFTAANFLGYGNNLQVVRVVDNDAKNAGSSQGTLIKNDGHYVGASISTDDKWVARYPGDRGNSLQVVWHDGGAGTSYDGLLTLTVPGASFAAGVTIGSFTSAGASGAGNSAALDFIGRVLATSGTGGIEVETVTGALSGASAGSLLQVLSAYNGTTFAAGVTGLVVTNTAGDVTSTSQSDYKNWKYADQFQINMPHTTQWAENRTGSTTVNDGVNIAVIDEDGEFTGTKGTVLETFTALSKASNAKGVGNDSNFYKTIINDTSRYIWWGEHPTDGVAAAANTAVSGGSQWGTELAAAGGTFSTLLTSGTTTGYSDSLTGGTGQDGGTISTGSTQGFGLFEDAETVDVDLLLGGPADPTLGKALVDLCDARKDCVVFLSPESSDVLASGTPLIESTCETNVLDYRETQLNKSSSYAFLDSGWKYMYDRYNDVYRWVPLNGDIAGLAVRSDELTETWFSPAGFNRGQIRGAVKLAWNPRKTHRDNLYKEQVNPVVAFPGEGTVLFGDKTLQAKPSAFDRLNVRRLFIVLEKAISTAAKYQLFEQNDAFTRANFKNMIEPFLRDVQSRRGVIDFKVVCDESNNPGSVIDRNEFVADIYIKPTRSINFITLNFVATSTGVDFTEIGA